ncbi:high frequency lysogenization protein HflD [Streptomyces kaniharaensis]|uniref:High frequency lysogenization protein HflD n=1 Tax=Streptomyces kaniharaensis TaxID=212423 RepID=A0A6N7KZ99_9ACTN|nr:sulfite exporter TauE/SafE family protein [Streptomyces kaniharaensis]MQS16751.1 high frequency lysogenization protein HflD [Streptomyces kaniharaensis]
MNAVLGRVRSAGPRPARWAAAAGSVLWLVAAAPQARAHPLGNFSVNHYTGLTLHPDRVEVLAVTDAAEIPTLQDAPRVADGHPAGDAERAAWANARCADTAAHLAVTVPERLAFTVRSAAFDYQPGQAGLRTSRLECRLEAPVDLTAGRLTLHVDTGADPTRVGWNEITARGQGVRLDRSTVPDVSSSKELRDYPRDMLTTPRGDTRAEITAAPDDGRPAPAGVTTTAANPGTGLSARIEALSGKLAALVGTGRLTLPVGLLAVALATVLGAGHAVLPGHGKTVMAAYLAGRRGRTRDAVTVGATVTLTHTAGVLVVGLCLSAFSSLAGDTLLGWLGVASGALVAAIGVNLLTDAVRRSRHAASSRPGRRGRPETGPTAVTEPAVALTAAARAGADHHSHAHPGPHAGGGDGHHEHPHADGDGHHHAQPHRHGLFGHHHTHHHDVADQPFTTKGLVGLGIAGGLVPSPSALVVLLGAVALGRTVFGVALVVAYGLGMTITLTAIGLLLVRLQDRLARAADRPAFVLARRIAPHTAALTAVLVLLVGLGLIVRSLPTVL